MTVRNMAVDGPSPLMQKLLTSCRRCKLPLTMCHCPMSVLTRKEINKRSEAFKIYRAERTTCLHCDSSDMYLDTGLCRRCARDQCS